MTTTTTESVGWRGGRCLVTGSTGFIGQALCARLKALGAEVHGSRHRSPAGGVDDQQTCDVSIASEVEALFARVRPNCVFHLAGVVDGARSLNLVRTTLAANLVGTVNVLMCAATAECSNVVVVGSLQEPDDVHPAVPSSPYAAAKFSASAYARMFAQVFGLPVVIARTFMVYGAGQVDFAKLVPYVARQLITGSVAELTSGRQSFDWVYVDDVVEAMIAIASRPDLAGHTIDIGTGQLTSVIEVASGVARRLCAIDRLLVGAVPDRKGEPTRTADVAATEALINWRAKMSIEQGLDRAVPWYEEYLLADPRRGGPTSPPGAS